MTLIAQALTFPLSGLHTASCLKSHLCSTGFHRSAWSIPKVQRDRRERAPLPFINNVCVCAGRGRVCRAGYCFGLCVSADLGSGRAAAHCRPGRLKATRDIWPRPYQFSWPRVGQDAEGMKRKQTSFQWAFIQETDLNQLLKQTVFSIRASAGKNLCFNLGHCGVTDGFSDWLNVLVHLPSHPACSSAEISLFCWDVPTLAQLLQSLLALIGFPARTRSHKPVAADWAASRKCTSGIGICSWPPVSSGALVLRWGRPKWATAAGRMVLNKALLAEEDDAKRISTVWSHDHVKQLRCMWHDVAQRQRRYLPLCQNIGKLCLWKKKNKISNQKMASSGLYGKLCVPLSGFSFGVRRPLSFGIGWKIRGSTQHLLTREVNMCLCSLVRCNGREQLMRMRWQGWGL